MTREEQMAVGRALQNLRDRVQLEYAHMIIEAMDSGTAGIDWEELRQRCRTLAELLARTTALVQDQGKKDMVGR